MPVVELIDALAALGPWESQWDGLARLLGAPLCAPAWMLSWWLNAAPPGAELRVVVVHEDDVLLGLGPYFYGRARAGRIDYRLLGSALSHRIGPLARPGCEPVVAGAIADTLTHATPRPDLITFEATAARSPWPDLLRARITHGAGTYLTARQPAPIVVLDGDHEGSFLVSRSANFRGQMKRLRRKLAERGGTVRVASGGPEDLERAVRMLGKLHRHKWNKAGHPGVVTADIERMLVDVGRHGGVERLRLWTVECDGEVIAVQVFVAAGDEVAYWNGGWDERYAELKPAMLAILAAVEDAQRRGERRVDLGGGAQPYKLRYANADDPLIWCGLMPHQMRYPVTRAQMLPMEARFRMIRQFKTMSPGAQTRIKKVLGRS